jgi:hypothetical protein
MTVESRLWLHHAGGHALAPIGRHLGQPAAAGITSGLPRVGERALTASIRSRKMPDRKFNLTVRELPPFLNDCGEAAPRHLVDNFAGFAASSG